jgi:hypothetical protein
VLPAKIFLDAQGAVWRSGLFRKYWPYKYLRRFMTAGGIRAEPGFACNDVAEIRNSADT